MELKTRVHVDATAAKGIPRVRRIEVSHGCVQEQEARRMLPISKVDGGNNSADQMAKNVGIEHAKKHTKAMGIISADGRSEAAAKLHYIEKKDGWKVEHEGVFLNVMKIHGVPRTDLFSPWGEEEYLVHSSDLETVRVTSGITSSGKVIEIEDNWKRPSRAQRVLKEEWNASTTFFVKVSARKKLRAVLAPAPKQR